VFSLGINGSLGSFGSFFGFGPLIPDGSRLETQI
jgi:hypothetical protein